MLSFSYAEADLTTVHMHRAVVCTTRGRSGGCDEHVHVYGFTCIDSMGTAVGCVLIGDKRRQIDRDKSPRFSLAVPNGGAVALR